MNIDAGLRPNNKPETGNQKLPKSTTRQIVWYWLPVLGLAAAIFVQSSFPSPDLLPKFSFSDKLMHVAAYALLSYLICRGVNSHSRYQYRWKYIFFIGVVGASLYGVSDEWHQSFVAGRYAEATDFLADFVGSIVGSGGYLWRFHRRHLD